MTLPTVVLVPGAWHSPTYYDKVITLLQNDGYPTVTVQLPSAGTPATMEDDATAVRAQTSALVEQGKQVVLVLHSYGGVPGTESAKGLAWKTRQAEGKPGGITALVYLTAYLLKEGMSTLEAATGERELVPAGDGMVLYERNYAVTRFYNDFPPEDDPYGCAERIRPQSFAAFQGKLTYAAYEDIPSVYLRCEKDQEVTPENQETFIGYCTGSLRVRSCAAGHSPMVTAPMDVFEAILLAARDANQTAAV